jgi:hypothetical protein
MQSATSDRVHELVAPSLAQQRPQPLDGAPLAMSWSILRELLFLGVLLVLASALANALLGLVFDLADRKRPELGAWIDVSWTLALAVLVYRSPGPRWRPWVTGTTLRLIVIAIAVLVAALLLLWRIGQRLQFKREFALVMARAHAAGLWGLMKHLVRGAPIPQTKCPACGESQHPGARFCHACGKPAAEEP